MLDYSNNWSWAFEAINQKSLLSVNVKGLRQLIDRYVSRSYKKNRVDDTQFNVQQTINTNIPPDNSNWDHYSWAKHCLIISQQFCVNETDPSDNEAFSMVNCQTPSWCRKLVKLLPVSSRRCVRADENVLIRNDNRDRCIWQQYCLVIWQQQIYGWPISLQAWLIIASLNQLRVMTKY